MSKELEVFEKWPYHLPKEKTVTKKALGFVAQLKKAETGEEALKVFKAMSRYSDKIADDITHVQVLFSLETQNPLYEKGMNALNVMLPNIQAATIEFVKAMVESPHRPYLESKLGKHLFEMYEYQLKSFDPAIIEEMTEENMLAMKYDALIAGVQIEFRGETYNLTQMGKFLTDKDRETRKEAAEAYYGYMETRVDEIEEIYDQLVKLRTKMAKKLGYKSYTELGYILMGRYDYTPEMVAGYREQIREQVTPLAEKLAKEQAKRLGLKKLEVYDLGVESLAGNPIPRGTTEEKVESAKKMYASLSPDTDYFFNFMADHHLLFLDAKPGKQAGGYMTYFPVHRCPIIFSNFNGTSGDVDVLTHEFGHSFQAYMARNIKVPEYRSPTMESCEIHSMSMEFFAEPYMDLFFDEPDWYRYSHLKDSIMFLPYGVTVDEFQHWVYENPEATPAERDAKWHELEVKYTPYKVRAYENCPYLKSGHRWLTQGHIFGSPFYYIDYTLAQVCAFQFFNMDRKNHERAWKRYLKLCKLGGTKTFVQLIRSVGLESPFEEGVLKKTMRPLPKVLASYHPENF